MELQENLLRAELTAPERKRQSGEYLRLSLGFSTDRTKSKSTDRTKSGRPTNWFSEWYKSANLAKTTASDHWRAFTQLHGIDCKPGDADGATQAAFAEYLIDRNPRTRK